MELKRPTFTITFEWHHFKPKWWNLDRRHYLMLKMPYSDYLRTRFFRNGIPDGDCLEFLEKFKPGYQQGVMYLDYANGLDLSYKYVGLVFDSDADMICFKLQHGDILRAIERESPWAS